MTASQTVRSYCRTCSAHCGVLVEREGQQVRSVRGDPSHPISQGYCCPKGRAMGALHHHPQRLDHPALRGSGGLQPVSWPTLLADLQRQLSELRAQHGPDALGVYVGTGAGFDSLGLFVANALGMALGTRSRYSAMTIDTPCLPLVSGLMTGAPIPNPVLDLEGARLTLIIGSNPMVSHGHTTAWPNPTRMLRTLTGEGRELWVADPRATATARQATRHLALRPATDHALLAYLLRELLSPGGGANTRHIDAHTLDVDRLTQAVEPWDLPRAAATTGLPERDLLDLRDAVRRHGRLSVLTGTGTSMQRSANAVEWLSWALQIVTDSFEREGGMWFHPGASKRLEQMDPYPAPVFQDAPGPASRPEVAGHFAATVGEFPCSVLVDEIEAGNLLTSFPDTPRVAAALGRLDVLAVADIVETPLTQRASHVLPCADPLERFDIPGYIDSAHVDVVSQIATPVFPPAAERRPLWWSLAKVAEGLQVDVLPGGLRADDAESEDLLRAILSGGRVDYDTLVADPGAAILHTGVREDLRGWVEQKLPEGRWRLAPEPLVAQLAALSERTPPPPATLRLISGRQLRKMNSALRDVAAPGERLDEARIHLHPTDAARAAIEEGEAVRVTRGAATVQGRARVDPAIREGAVWVPHGWPELCVSQLTSDRDAVDPLTGMVEQSGFEVAVSAAPR